MTDLEKENKELYIQLDKINHKYNKTTSGVTTVINSICKSCKIKNNCKKCDCPIYNIEQLLLK